MIASTFINPKTASDGTKFASLPDMPAEMVHIANTTTVALLVKRTNSGASFKLPVGLAASFRGINNANQLSVKRADDGVQITLESVEVEL